MGRIAKSCTSTCPTSCVRCCAYIRLKHQISKKVQPRVVTLASVPTNPSRIYRQKDGYIYDLGEAPYDLPSLDTEDGFIYQFRGESNIRHLMVSLFSRRPFTKKRELIPGTNTLERGNNMAPVWEAQRKNMGLVASIFDGKFKYDQEYFPTTVEPSWDAGLVDVLPTTDDVDANIYALFKHNVDRLRNSPYSPVNRVGRTTKLGVTTVETVLEDTAYRYSSREAAAKIRDNMIKKVLPYVGCLPKIGNTTSDGSIRTIFPMSSSLQAFYEKIFGKRDHFTFVDAAIISGPNFPHLEFTYDVTSCDKKAFPYWIKYVREELPDLEQLLIPAVCVEGAIRYPNQVPSGVFGITQFIPMIFAYSVARSATSDYFYIQGDGIMCKNRINSPLLRAEPPYTVNGFNYRLPEPRYANSLKRLTQPRLKDSRDFNGSELWHFKRHIHINFLKAYDSPPPRDQKLADKYANMPWQDLLKIAARTGHCYTKLAMMGWYNDYVDGRVSDWDAAPTKPGLVSYSYSTVDASLVWRMF